MKYSFIIPTLNEEKLLPQLLKQLKNSNLKNIINCEIIISDGGSRDSTVKIASEFADIVKTHANNKKQNIAIGRNEGAKYASGDILVFLNGDILFNDPEQFFTYVRQKFENSEYAAMTTRVKVFPEEEILSDKLFHGIYNKYFHLLNILGIGMGRGECQIIRKNIFTKLNGYNPDLAAGEDFDLFRRVRKLGKILFSTDVCVYESPRRFRKLGYKSITLIWIKNAFSVLFKNKSLSKEWEEVR